MPPLLVFWFFVLLLTVVLWFPLSKLCFVLAAKRRERKRGEPLAVDEQHSTLKHARAIAALVAFAISWFTSVATIGMGAGAGV